MARTALREPHVRPTDVLVRQAEVVRVSRPSPGFVRTTLRTDADGFTDRGADQWVRLFLPPAAGAPLVLPWGGSEGWYARWQRLPEQGRPVVRNYTVREARRHDDGWDLDVDLVVHRSADGTVEGLAARWALAAEPGTTVGLLEQGTLFRPEEAEHDRVLLLTDESGLPGVEAVLRGLPPHLLAEVAVEVPDAGDVRDLPCPAPLEAHWLVRPAGRAAGSCLLEHLRTSTLGPRTYLYAVGETSFVAAVRQQAAARDLPAEAVDVCAYWSGARRRG